MFALAKMGALTFAFWLILASIAMVIWPKPVLKFLSKMGSTPTIHFGEHILRGLAGLSLMGIAKATHAPNIYWGLGVFLLGTSVLIGLAPRRWHHGYAQYWSQKISPAALRWMSPLPLIAGLFLGCKALAL